MKLDSATLRKIKTIANEQSRAAFAERKRALTAECMNLMAAGGDVDAFLEQQYLEAMRGAMALRLNTHASRACVRLRAQDGEEKADAQL